MKIYDLFGSGISSICTLAAAVLFIAALWKVFVKAGKPGWAVLIPFYNYWCLFDIAFGQGWLFLLLFVPFANIVMLVLLPFKLAKAFGESFLFGLGLLFLPFVFLPLLGFGTSKYAGRG